MTIDWQETDVQIITERSGRHRFQRGFRVDPVMKSAFHNYDLLYVWAGRGRIKTPDGVVELHRGTCLWIGPGWSYDQKQDPDHPLGLSFIHFKLYTQGKLVNPRLHKNRPPDLLHIGAPQLVESVIRRVLKFCWACQTDQATTPFEELSVSLLLKGLLMELTQSPLPEPASGQSREQDRRRVVAELTTYIHDNIYGDLSIDHLVKKAGYSAGYLTRIFKDITGLSLRAYIISARLAAARHLLSTSSLKVSAIADRLGYRNIYFFSRQFKQHTNQSPSEYRNTH